MNRWIILIAMVLNLTGCLGTSQPSRYFMLTSAAEPADTRQAKADKVVGIGPVELPKYLDRTNIIYRSGSNQVIVSDFDSWAEPLVDGVQRVLVQNIGAGITETSMSAVARQSTDMHDFEVPIFLERFECEEHGACLLRLRWSIKGEEAHTLFGPIMSDFADQSASTMASDQSAALSFLLGEAGKSIAAALRKVESSLRSR